MLGPRPALPDIRTGEEFAAVRRDEAQLRPGVQAIQDRLGLRSRPAVRFPDGSLPVYAIGDDRVLKLYPPLHAPERDREALALALAASHLPIPTPTVEAVGDLDGWAWLLMERLRGEPLPAIWPGLGAEDRRRLAGDLGEGLAVLHAIRDPRGEPLRADWNAFLAAQRDGCVARQARLGLDPLWLDQIAPFLESVEWGREAPDSLLHTEIMREHLLAGRSGGTWRLSGLFDFEPAMIGTPSYEFASVGVFFAGGDREVLRETLIAYGYAERDLTPELAERFLAMALLHRYSNLPWFLERLAPPADVVTLPALARLGWGG